MGLRKKRYWPAFNIIFHFRLEKLRKLTKNLCRSSRSLGRDLNPGPPKYQARMLTAQQQQRSVSNHEAKRY
jgi:hypothetical protein